MAVFKLVEGLTYSGIAGENLTGKLNRFVSLNSSLEVVLAAENAVPIGTLFEEGPLGAAVSVQCGGIAKVIVDTAVSTPSTLVSVGAAGGAKPAGSTGVAGVALAAGAANVVIPVLFVPSAKA